jgi:hypothetical protein
MNSHPFSLLDLNATRIESGIREHRMSKTVVHVTGHVLLSESDLGC